MTQRESSVHTSGSGKTNPGDRTERDGDRGGAFLGDRRPPASHRSHSPAAPSLDPSVPLTSLNGVYDGLQSRPCSGPKTKGGPKF